VSNVNTLAVLEGIFLGTFGRPKNLKPVDFVVASTLVLVGAHERPVNISQRSLGSVCGVSEPTVAASLRRLEEEDWVEVCSSSHGRTSQQIRIELSAIPLPDSAYE
jgi:DNA-binding MarR family transcriptional regulator